MAIVNLTPDSFSGDGLLTPNGNQQEAAIRYAFAQIEAGADLLDLGAESSRPGAMPISSAEELARLLPILDALRDCAVPISVDTYKPEVMRAALAHGAAMINDIYALRMPGALAAVKDSDCGLCLMHMQGEPLSMQQQPQYTEVVTEVRAFFSERLDVVKAHGIAPERLLLDPGFGFGKTLAHNLELLRRLAELAHEHVPLLVGLSRKSMLGTLTGRASQERQAASVAAALLAAQNGAQILRVHDVAATRDALAVWQAVLGSASA